MAIQLSDLIEKLQDISKHYGGDLMVITDEEQGVSDAEYNDEDGSPACVLVIEVVA